MEPGGADSAFRLVESPYKGTQWGVPLNQTAIDILTEKEKIFVMA
jgi:hypothetical protein